MTGTPPGSSEIAGATCSRSFASIAGHGTSPMALLARASPASSSRTATPWTKTMGTRDNLPSGLELELEPDRRGRLDALAEGDTVTGGLRDCFEDGGEAVVVDVAGDLVGDGLDLVGSVAHGDAPGGPVQHLEVVALVAAGDGVDRLDAQLATDELEGACLGHALGVDVEPRGPAHGIRHAVETGALDELHELFGRGLGLAERDAGDGLGDELGPVDLAGLAHELAVGEVLAHLEADAGLLDGDERVGEGDAHLLEHRARVEGHHVDDRVALWHMRVEPERQGAVGADGVALAQ